MQIPDSVSISALWNDYVRNASWFSPNFTHASKLSSILHLVFWKP